MLAFEQPACDGAACSSGSAASPSKTRVGTRIAREPGYAVGVTTSYPAAELTGAELIVDGLQVLTIPMLDALVQ